MEDFMPCFNSLNGIAFAVSSVIFLLTLLFVGMRWIGFSITLLLLLFSLAAGVIVSNIDIIRNYFHSELQHKDRGTGEDVHQFRKNVESALKVDEHEKA